MINSKINWKAEYGIGEVATVIKVVLRNFAKFTGNHLYQSLFLNKVAGLLATASAIEIPV